MSGNPDKVPGGGGRRSNSGADSCATIDFEISLFSPSPSIIVKLLKGDFLSIVLDPKTLATVLAVTEKGEVAGTIIGSKMSTIASCLKKGFRFKGEIIKLYGGNCTLHITPE